ncbi:hypothetical protein HG535_0A06960 [Zygotorulaspora mrakii]|uniref:Autophagy-related protein 3 n=1 Tax=Zygotorulaspora mrakii TaxID=42260 RepID=A0A7H9AXD7_ZYGMR|nr:uncharacterized protein HG535_0A06960 [Zygotorulaspora mrakii]QLG70754.1 hypothetical protein HG535_0A06960 [Zygotorulaspora mrakii]
MLRSTLSSWREYLTPVSHKSTFLSTGQVTPEEFVEAGDYLCHMFPTWSWNETSNDIVYKEFLPKDKQFLVSRKVPCGERAQGIIGALSQAKESEFFDDYNDKNSTDEGWLLEGEGLSSTKEAGFDSTSAEINDIDEMMKEMEIEGDNDDTVDLPVKEGERYYDLYITYSTSYRVPKMYIVGFSGSGAPLTPNQMFEDIAPDYRTKTATIEKLPFYKSSTLSVSIHPCKHANVMKILLDKVRIVKRRRRKEQEQVQSQHNDDWEDLQNDFDDSLRVDQYLVVFLKFITSVTPSIEHDYTMEGW